METRQRIELIVERMAYKRAGRIFEDSGITGYTVLPALAGFGRGNKWSRDTDISASSDMVIMIAIGDDACVQTCLDQFQQLLGQHIGVVSVSSVKVLRPERF
ncbi:MAG: DUF190 domain-containing protein [Pseudomonadota bacterium]